MKNKQLVEIVIILLLGAVLRFHALGQDVRFHPDEALFVTFARQAAVQGDWLLHGSLDKPPLTIYINALALTAFGVKTLSNGVLTLDIHVGEFAARVIGVFASILLIAVCFTVARRFYGVGKKAGDSRIWTSSIAALMIALSPLAVAFSATAFTDGLMLLCVAVALWMGGRGKWVWAGIWLALGLWTKQQALLYVPLVLLIAAVYERRVGRSISAVDIVRFVAPIAAGIGLLFVWDGVRGQETSLWTLATVNNDPGHFSRMDELFPRLEAWWQFGQFGFGGAGVTAILVIAAGAGRISQVKQSRQGVEGIDVVLVGYVVGYLLIHWLVAINIYDRYLLLILPPLALIVARGLDTVSYAVKGVKISRAFLLILLMIGLPAAWAASENQLAIGGDRGQHNGIEQVAEYLNKQSLGAIIYDHWLGWELGYYMGTWSDKRRVYYPTPDALATDALLQADRAPRYFVVPDWVDAGDWLEALRGGKFKVMKTYHHAPFAVYELLRP